MWPNFCSPLFANCLSACPGAVFRVKVRRAPDPKSSKSWISLRTTLCEVSRCHLERKSHFSGSSGYLATAAAKTELLSCPHFSKGQVDVPNLQSNDFGSLSWRFTGQSALHEQKIALEIRKLPMHAIHHFMAWLRKHPENPRCEIGNCLTFCPAEA